MALLSTQVRSRLRSRLDPTPDGVAKNIRAYAARAGTYDNVHGEIFNHIEQERLRHVLSVALDAVASGGQRALDFGAGTGNLTRHLTSLGCEVTAADVSPEFLDIIKTRYGVPTIELIDGSLTCVPDSTYDLIGVYSVMHHIPDYLGAAAGLIAKLRPGGILMIDHEQNDEYWQPSPTLTEFREANANARTGRLWDPEHKRWQYLLRAAVVPARHVARVRRRLRISDEGDIHVYEDDHIEWDPLLAALQQAGAELVTRIDYLVFREGYDERIWNAYRDRCNDHTCAIVRRTTSADMQPVAR